MRILSLPTLAAVLFLMAPLALPTPAPAQGQNPLGGVSPSKVIRTTTDTCSTGPVCPGGCNSILLTPAQQVVLGPSRAGNLPPTVPGLFKFNTNYGTLKAVQIVVKGQPVNRSYHIQNTDQNAPCLPLCPAPGIDPVVLRAALTVTLPTGTLADLGASMEVIHTSWPSNSSSNFTLATFPAGGQINYATCPTNAFPQTICPSRASPSTCTDQCAQIPAPPACPGNDNCPPTLVNPACNPDYPGQTLHNPPTSACYEQGISQNHSGYSVCFADGPEETLSYCVTDDSGTTANELAPFLATCGTAGGCGQSAPTPLCPTELAFSVVDQDLSSINDSGINCPFVSHARTMGLKLTVAVSYIYCPANQPPTTNPDVAVVCPNGGTACPSFVDIPVLANDCDPDQGCPAVFGRLNCGSLAVCTQPVHGTISIVGCGGASSNTGCPQTNNCSGCVLRYTPAVGYSGTDTFCYTVADTGDGAGGPPLVSCPTPVSIRVLPPPNALDDTFATLVNTPVTLNVLCNDTGAAATSSAPNNTTCIGCTGTALTALNFPGSSATTIVCSSAQIVTGPAHGTLQAAFSCAGTSGSCSTGSNCFRYTPAPGYCGADSFVYKVLDSAGCCDTATVNLTIYSPPLAVNDNYTLCEDASCEASNCIVMNVLGNDVPNGGTSCPSGTGSALNCSSIVITQQPIGGTLTLGTACGGLPNNGCTSACIRYCPTPGFRGVDTFRYRVSDSRTNTNSCQSAVFPGVSNEATVTLTVCCAPDAVDDTVEDPDPLDLAPIIIDVLANDLPFVHGLNDDACAGLTLDPTTLAINSGGTACPAPTKGTVTVITDIDGRRKILYTPTVPLGTTGHDQFSYLVKNSCGCCDTACVQILPPPPCNERRRDICGSLLLFPELDNRTGRITLLTVTDGCCGAPAQSTLVESVFVRKETCTELNSTFGLTPCDTFSILSTSLVPANSQGFLYVFAKNGHTTAANPNGTPIVFNHLIGEALVLDGTLATEYAVNAISFRGLGNEGAENDDDGDGIRDFNGPTATAPEYEEVPREILLPRFLGQDGGGNPFYSSEVVLVALSGGSAFQTRVTISGFNDNETAFGSTWTFTCWDRVPLLQLAGGTATTQLLVNNDPDEIVGWPGPGHEAGWIEINGDQAFSSQETIHDPAVYALLIERAGAAKVATLPFEICSQINGALLPHHPLGDGDPVPASGDDQ